MTRNGLAGDVAADNNVSPNEVAMVCPGKSFVMALMLFDNNWFNRFAVAGSE